MTATVRHDGDWCSLVASWPRSHYHFLHDAATRLPGLLDRLPSGTRFVVSPETPVSHHEVLLAFGIPADRVATIPRGEEWQFERLHVVSPAAYAGHDRAELDRAVRDRVLDHFGITFGRPTRRVFLSRRRQQRRVVNENAVVALLEPFGFEAIVPEELSLRDQVALFAETEIVVSNHGSAFTGALFAPPGLVLVDAVDPQMEHCAHVFWSLCGALGHEYWFLRADRAPNPNARRDDVDIPLHRLAATLEAAGIARRA